MSNDKVITSFFITTVWSRAEDPWCVPCAKSSVIQSPVLLVSLDTGVGLWGSSTLCRECNTRVWVSLKGNVIPVELMS